MRSEGSGVRNEGSDFSFPSFTLPLFAFFLALTIRAVFAVQWNATPYGGAPFLDAKAYDDWATLIANGELLRVRAFYQSPLYPYVLGFLYRVFGHSYLLASFLNALLDAGTVAVLTAISSFLSPMWERKQNLRFARSEVKRSGAQALDFAGEGFSAPSAPQTPLLQNLRTYLRESKILLSPPQRGEKKKPFSESSFSPTTAALITALLASFYGPMIFYTGPLMKEPLCLFLLSLFLFFSLKAFGNRKIRDFAFSGLFLGLAALTRGNILLLAPAFLAICFWRERRGALKPALTFTAALLFTLAPATIHNAIASRDFVPTSFADGFNLYIGHSPYANGVNAYPPEVSTDPVQEELNTIWVAEKETGHALKPSQVSHFWRSRALDFMLHNPAQELTLLSNKIEAFWNNAQRFDNYDVSFFKDHFRTILNWPLVDFWLISFLAAFGAVALIKNPNHPYILPLFSTKTSSLRAKRGNPVPNLQHATLVDNEGLDCFASLAMTDRFGIFPLLFFAATYMLSVLLFYVTDRYRLPIVVFLLPLAGAAVPAGMALIQEKNWKRFAAACTVAFVFLFMGLRPDRFAPDLRAFNWGMLTMLYEEQGRHNDAIASLEKGLAISPKNVGNSAFSKGADAYLAQKNEVTAEKLLIQATEIFPDNGMALYNLGRLKAYQGKLPEALALFEKGAKLTPFYVLNYLGIASVQARFGHSDAALAAIHKGLSIDPAHKDLLALKMSIR